ncbi:MAG: molybdate ABC transporter substrate-binding protein, partial [Eggerthellaceae bacterium]|nr:molybdate ABC transporter substrate-binding protein [Eggerthellaceae bacterium]
MSKFGFIRVVFAVVLAVGLLGMFGCSGDQGQAEGDQQSIELQVFAANSLSKAMEEVQDLYVSTHEGVTFKDSQYLGSGDLNAQLQAGAYADLLISASSGKMNDAVEAGLVDESTRFNMFANDLVMAVSKDSAIESITLEEVAAGSYTVAVGDDSVPAGNYANQALSTVGCFIDPDGKVGAESAGKANSTDAYKGTPLEGRVNLQASVGNVCQQAAMGAVDVA